jgi:hypothetical protein
MTKDIKKMDVRTFLADIANELLPNQEYSLRIEIDDGGYNSYIGFDVDLDDWEAKGKIKALRLFRHTNSTAKISSEWQFQLGEICNEYHCYPDIPVRFSSFGKTPTEAQEEAVKYYSEIMRLVRKQTSAHKIRLAETAKEEREKLLARLSELDGAIND